eukprot:gene11331-biopygen15950
MGGSRDMKRRDNKAATGSWFSLLAISGRYASGNTGVGGVGGWVAGDINRRSYVVLLKLLGPLPSRLVMQRVSSVAYTRYQLHRCSLN